MNLTDKVIVITGAGSGIGEALARRFADAEPRGLVLADINPDTVAVVAEQLKATAVAVDVSDPDDNGALIAQAEEAYGPIDLFCANAGYAMAGDEQTAPDEWNRMWDVNLMSHVHAARHLIPRWTKRGSGYFLSTASAAGLLTNLRAAQYSVTKHAAVAFSEWLAITYGDQGVRVSCLCPMGVNTPLLDTAEEFSALLGPQMIEPSEVADAVVDGLDSERFLILPHPDVARYFQNKANDYDRWLLGMKKLQDAVFPR